MANQSAHRAPTFVFERGSVNITGKKDERGKAQGSEKEIDERRENGVQQQANAPSLKSLQLYCLRRNKCAATAVTHPPSSWLGAKSVASTAVRGQSFLCNCLL